jgi:hypothetical protein
LHFENHTFHNLVILFFVFLEWRSISKGLLRLILTFSYFYIAYQTKDLSQLFLNFQWVKERYCCCVLPLPICSRTKKHLFPWLFHHEIEYYKQFVESDVKMIISAKLHSNSGYSIFMTAIGFPRVQIVFYKLWKNRKILFKTVESTSYFCRYFRHWYYLPHPDTSCTPIQILSQYKWCL